MYKTLHEQEIAKENIFQIVVERLLISCHSIGAMYLLVVFTVFEETEKSYLKKNN